MLIDLSLPSSLYGATPRCQLRVTSRAGPYPPPPGEPKLARPLLARPVGHRDVLDRRPRACRLLEEGHELIDLLRHFCADRQTERLALLRGDRIVVGPGSRGELLGQRCRLLLRHPFQ